MKGAHRDGYQPELNMYEIAHENSLFLDANEKHIMKGQAIVKILYQGFCWVRLPHSVVTIVRQLRRALSE